VVSSPGSDSPAVGGRSCADAALLFRPRINVVDKAPSAAIIET
jgi:hypothetical protein